jgi:hypothetical protein
MELLIRWHCPCLPPRELCRFCRGNGYLERWLSQELVRHVVGGQVFLIRDRSIAPSPHSSALSSVAVLPLVKRDTTGSTLFVDGLPQHFTADRLKDLFAPFGTVLWSRVVAGFSGDCSGFGYVDMAMPHQALKAVKTLDGYEIDGKYLVVMVSTRAPHALQAQRLLELNSGKAFCELCIRSHLAGAQPSREELLDAFNYLYECHRFVGMCFECWKVTQVFSASSNS